MAYTAHHKWIYSAYSLDKYRVLVLANRPSDRTLLFFLTRTDGTIQKLTATDWIPDACTWVPELWARVHPVARASIRHELAAFHGICRCGAPSYPHSVDALFLRERRRLSVIVCD